MIEIGTSPLAKVRNAGISGSVITLAVYLSGKLGYPVPADIATAFVTLVTYLAAYITPLTRKDLKK